MTAQAFPAWQELTSGNSPTNAIKFMIKQAMAQASHVTIVLVKAVHGGGVAAPPTVDVQPMVAQIDQQGNAQAHGTIYGLPTMRIQGGANAIIIDPQVGDIGVCVFADRDISSAVANQAPANPGSWRRFDWSDGIYLYSIGQTTPTQYVEITNDAINITSSDNPINITTGGADVNVNAGSGTATVTAATVNLGDAGGHAVARVGDTVNLTTGLIETGSSVTFST